MATASVKKSWSSSRHNSDTLSDPCEAYTPESQRRRRVKKHSGLSRLRSLSRDASPCGSTHSLPCAGLTSTPQPSGCRSRLHSAGSGVIILEESPIRAADPTEDDAVRLEQELVASLTARAARSSSHTPYTEVQAPIVGYEIMEERARFTVFKVHVARGEEDWFIFRRYTDFVRLNEKLRERFPHFRLSLPPKKWFGDNFERAFLDERMLGLQAFLNNVTSHRDVADSPAVRQFFCYDDPPGAHDSLEESKALCETLEEKIYQLRRELQERDAKILLLQEEVSLHKAEVENLRKSLRLECTIYSNSLVYYRHLDIDHVLNLVLLNLIERALTMKQKRSSPTSVSVTSQRSTSSILQDQISYTEADQAHMDKASSSCAEEEGPSDVFESASSSSVDEIAHDLDDVNLHQDDINTDPNANCHSKTDLVNTEALIASLNCVQSADVFHSNVGHDNSTELEWDDNDTTEASNVLVPSSFDADSRRGSSVLSVV